MSTGGSIHTFPPAPAGQVISLPATKSRRRTSGVVLGEQEMSQPAAYDVAGGTVVVVSVRSPSKTTPNEDVAAVLSIDSKSGVLIVADGLGGHAGGEQASRLAVDTLRKSLAKVASADGPANGDALRSAILDGIETANKAVLELATGAATTLAVVEIQKNVIRPYHVGDSAILVTGQRGKLKLQTIPHSPIGYAVESGLLDEQDAMHHEERHVISNVIGASDMRIEIGPSLKLAQRDTLLLASDGLFDNLMPKEVVDGIRTGSLTRGVELLAQEAHKRMTAGDEAGPSKPDDLTIIAYRRK